MPKSLYQTRIAEIVGSEIDPRHVEAFLRFQYKDTLDRLSPERFAAEAQFVAVCLAEIGADEGEKVARSYGL